MLPFLSVRRNTTVVRRARAARKARLNLESLEDRNQPSHVGPIQPLPPPTAALLTGDFNGDGRIDVAEFDNQGALGEWHVSLSTGSSFTTGTRWNTTNWSGAASWADFEEEDVNGDGLADVIGISNQGRVFVGFSTGTSFVTRLVGTIPDFANTAFLEEGDVNGDGLQDLITFSNAGQWRVGINNGSTLTFVNFGQQWSGAAAWDYLDVGDFNGDGRDDVVGFSNFGDWWVGLSNGAAFLPGHWARWDPAANWAEVVIGDFNGDGADDVGGFGVSGSWWVGISTVNQGDDDDDDDDGGVLEDAATGAFATSQWAQWDAAANWAAVIVEDFDGDGEDDVAGFSQAGAWWVGLSTGDDEEVTGSFATRQWAQWVSGAASWAGVVAADFTGDGRADVGALSLARNWYVGTSTGSAFSTRFWGSLV